MGVLVLGAAHTAMAALSNRRLRHMAEIDEKLAELEGFSDYIREYQEATAEVDADEEDDADYLMSLERVRQEREYEGLKGTLWEPSLVICWIVIAFVTLYVVIAIITGHPESSFKDEL